VRSAAAGTGSSMSGVARGSLGSKELNYVLRVLGPGACRVPELFTQVAKNTLRIVLPPPAKRGRSKFVDYYANNIVCE
jgi:E3 ubiquitin-protein ligase HUWE1